MPKITHYTLNTDHVAEIDLSLQDADAVNKIGTGLIVMSRLKRVPLPLPDGDLAHLQYLCKEAGGNLVVTIYAPNGPYEKGKPYYRDDVRPLIMTAIAVGDDRDRLYQMLIGNYRKMYNRLPDMAVAPPGNWMATVVYPAAKDFGDEVLHLADLTQVLAHSWMTFHVTNV